MSSGNVQGISIAMWYDGVSMCETYAHVSMLYNFAEGQTRRIHIVVAFDNVQLWSHLSQVVVDFFVFQIAQAYDLPDLSGCEKLAELWKE